ncbi:MAG TPA: abortive infection family protein [Acidothermaceae bacterium]
MDLILQRPDLLDDAAWLAVEQHRVRLASALSSNDAPWIIGSAKELVECVARVVSTAKGTITPSNADFADVVNDAHVALDRQAGPGITRASDVRAIAQNAKKIVLSVKDIRNDFGTGHGHAEVRSIADEMVQLVVAGALLWVRWALVRVAHLILNEPAHLIAELRGPVTRRSLQSHLDALVLPEPPDDIQRALGIAFAHRSASGTFVAREVGLEAPAKSDNTELWPGPYRLGVVEGLTISSNGYFMLGVDWVPMVVDILLPLPPTTIKNFLRDLTAKVTSAGSLPNASVEDHTNLARGSEGEVDRLPEAARVAWLDFATEVDPTASE